MLSKKINKWKNKVAISVVALSAVAINGCSGKGDKASYDMKTQSIFAEGCLNLGNLYASLHSMPGDGIVRAVTSDFTIVEDGSPSSSVSRILNVVSYAFEEGRPSELQRTWTSASQQGCSSGQLFDVYGNSTPFTVEEYKDSWIKVKLPDESTQRFDLTSERSMRIFTNENKRSPCVGHVDGIPSQTETVLRWGPASSLPDGEIVSSRYMRELSQSAATAPAALRSSVSEVTTDSLSLSASLLREMTGMTVNAGDLKNCPSTAKAPTAPPLPTPTPGPTPGPTPDPNPTEGESGEPSPDPTPEATPAPSPTPEI